MKFTEGAQRVGMKLLVTSLLAERSTWPMDAVQESAYCKKHVRQDVIAAARLQANPVRPCAIRSESLLPNLTATIMVPIALALK